MSHYRPLITLHYADIIIIDIISLHDALIRHYTLADGHVFTPRHFIAWHFLQPAIDYISL
jgi:hypothetical protein